MEQHFKNKLQSYQPEPWDKEGLWTDIEAALPPKKKKRKRLFLFFLFGLGLIGLGFGSYLLSNATPIDKKMPVPISKKEDENVKHKKAIKIPLTQTQKIENKTIDKPAPSQPKDQLEVQTKQTNNPIPKMK